MEGLSKMRELSSEEKLKIELFVEDFLGREVFSWDILDEDLERNRFRDNRDTMELKVIEYIIETLDLRIAYY
jgi:hypothetical protein|tara:strand:+ start:333 stop:548 length:216 start_codon:yes stop_codon:yes gene_type:complete